MGVVLAIIFALTAAAGAQASWSGALSLATPRYNQTATLLDDGRVLVAGGNDAAPLASTELYDAATNGWSPAAPMNVARQGHGAALLSDGRVFVAGGQTSGDTVPVYTDTAEIYDPAGNAWTQTPAMSTPRFQPTVTALRDGRVLVAGGVGDSGPGKAIPLDSAEVYDPGTGIWTSVPAMSTPRWLATATVLGDGKVLVAGGFDGAQNPVAGAQLFDPATDAWGPAAALAQARGAATATVLPGDKVLVAGGENAARAAIASAEIYDAGTDAWSPAGSMATAREHGAAAALDDGSVLVAGGEDARNGAPTASAERYDPAASTWGDAGPLAGARAQYTLTALNDGRAIAVGGNPVGDFQTGIATVERFSTQSATLTAASFGTVAVGASAEATATLTNTGTKPLVTTGISIAGANPTAFAVVSDTCLAGPVAPNGTCTVTVRFAPKGGGSLAGTLSVADTSTAAGATTAALNGTGLAPTPAGGGTGAAPAPAPATGAPAAGGAAGQAGAGGQGAATRKPGQAVLGASAKASCVARTTRSKGRRRSTVTCRVTMPTSARVALRARLLSGRTALASAKGSVRSKSLALTLRPSKPLRAGRYTVVITQSNGTVILRQQIRVR